MNRCTILVSSCDKYSDVWDVFFKLFTKQWPDNKFPIILNTETIDYHYDGLDVKTFGLFKDKPEISWSNRMIETLKLIDSEYIFTILDDFFFEKKVDNNKILELIDIMDKNEDIAAMYLAPINTKKHDDKRFENFEVIDKKAPYILNAQVAMWKKEVLLSFLRPHENPWEFEILGSKRHKNTKYNFYTIKDNEKNYIVKYDWKNGGGLHAGKWVKGIDKLFIDNDIDVDFNARGFEERLVTKTDKFHYYLERLNPRDLKRIITTRIKSMR